MRTSLKNNSSSAAPPPSSTPQSPCRCARRPCSSGAPPWKRATVRPFRAARFPRYSPAVCTGAHKHRVEGNPDVRHVSTSFVERQDLTMHMSGAFEHFPRQGAFYSATPHMDVRGGSRKQMGKASDLIFKIGHYQNCPVLDFRANLAHIPTDPRCRTTARSKNAPVTPGPDFNIPFAPDVRGRRQQRRHAGLSALLVQKELL